MSLFLKDQDKYPRKGWAALQPETETLVQANDYHQLALAVEDYRTGNGLPIEPNFTRQLHAQICAAMSEGERAKRCRPDTANTPKRLRPWRSRFDDLWNFGIAVKAALASKAAFVPKPVADARGKICAKCPFNLPVANCRSCGVLGQLFREIAGHLRTTSDALLETCDVCGCSNTVQVHLEGGLLAEISAEQGRDKSEFPDGCWKKELL